MRKVPLLRRVKPFHSQTSTSLCYVSLNLMRRVHLLRTVEPLCLQTSTSLCHFLLHLMRRVHLLCAILPFITWDFTSPFPILRASDWVGTHNCRQRPHSRRMLSRGRFARISRTPLDAGYGRLCIVGGCFRFT